MTTFLTIVLSVFFVLFNHANASSVDSIINGQFSENATDQERYDFLLYTSLSQAKTGEILTTCEIFTHHDLSKPKDTHIENAKSNWNEFRTYAYCDYIKSQKEPSRLVSDANKWANENIGSIAYKYSIERSLEYYIDDTTKKVTSCANYSNSIADYSRRGDSIPNRHIEILKLNCDLSYYEKFINKNH